MLNLKDDFEAAKLEMEALEISRMQDVLQELFGDKKIRWFQSSDAYKRVAGGETFVTYSYDKGYKGAVIISIGGNGIDETPIKVCNTAQQIKTLVEAIIY